MRTTVLIPLHGSARWLPVVTGTIERLAPHARVIVSDATGLDATLPRLREHFGDLENIDWVGPRTLRPGWVAHCNDLAARAATEFVMWMPHDDETDASWVTSGERALDENPGAVLALGSLRSLELDERGVHDPSAPSRVALDPHPPFLDSNLDERVRAALSVCVHGRRRFLGMAFRGVFRRESAVPLPDTTPDGAWADALWGVSMLCVGSFAATDAVYWKRWYDGNTHGGWGNPRTDPVFRAELLPDALAPLPSQVDRMLGSAWAEDALWLEARTARLRARRKAARKASRRLRRRVRALELREAELRDELAQAQARNRRHRGRLRRS